MQPMPLMITAAFVIEGLLANYVDMVLLLILNIGTPVQRNHLAVSCGTMIQSSFSEHLLNLTPHLRTVNCGLAYYEASKAADAIAALKSSLKPAAQVRKRSPPPPSLHHRRHLALGICTHVQ